MSYTNQTANYGLPQYVADDKPTYLGDFNKAMLDIDTNMKTIDNKATASETASNNANSTSQEALEVAQNNATQVSSLATQVSQAVQTAQNAQTDASNAITSAGTANTNANSANTKAEQALTNSQTALSNSQSAINTANGLESRIETLENQITSLFSNHDASPSDDTQLSDDYNNYDELEIYYRSTTGRTGSIKIEKQDYADSISLQISATTSSTFVLIDKIVSLQNNNSIHKESEYQYFKNNAGSETFTSTDSIVITKVLGYKNV